LGIVTLWAADWYKERHPEARANLYDALRAGTAPAPIPYAPAGQYSLHIFTPRERAEIEAENEADWEPWDLHDWERDHEIE
jgi:hypothetical protein